MMIECQVGLGKSIDKVSWALLLGAPLSVVFSLLIWHNVLAVFTVYHLGFCLVLPVVLNLGPGGRGFSEHLADLGLKGPGTGRSLLLGLVLAIVSGGGILLANHLLGAAFLTGNEVGPALESWAVGQEQVTLAAIFLGLVNAPAEELFWRGYLPYRLAGHSRRPNVLLLISVCYASYHGVTVFIFFASPGISTLILAGIFVAGLLWAWLREKTGSVWPALLSHAAVTAAYVFIWLNLT